MSEAQQLPSETLQPIRKRMCKKAFLGRLLLITGPFCVLLVCLYFYYVGGRFVSTDNAYVQADKVAISSQVSGAISEIHVSENSHVDKGQPLFSLDNRNYVIALEQARARLLGVKVEIESLKVGYRQKQGELKLAQVNTEYMDREYQRQSNLAQYKAVADAKIDEAKHNLDISHQRGIIVYEEMAQILARLNGDPEGEIGNQASYQLAKAEVAQAELNLERTVIRAPFAGRVSKLPKKGQYVETGKAVLSLIADSSFWIEANLKETELTHINVGQSAKIEIDTYPDIVWKGTVVSISPGTGGEYSILPAQNATGNWVKVVQRIPVRIMIYSDTNSPALLAGMSSTVNIDTQFHRGFPAVFENILRTIGISEAHSAN